MKTLFSILVAVAISTGGFVAYNNFFTPKDDNLVVLGGFNPAAGGTYRLQSSIGTTNTSITLSSFKEPISETNITMATLGSDIGYGTLDPQSSTRKEFISFTGITQNANGTATLTGVTRGLGFQYPYAASATYRKAHPGQSIFILSDSPQLFDEYTKRRTNEWITGTWGFSSNATSTTNCATASEYCRKDYVDNVVNQGAATSTESVAGIVELATQLEMASSTDLGADRPLVLQAKYATSTSPTPAGLYAVITNNAGKIAQSFLNLTESFTWTGAHIFNSSVSFTNTATFTGDVVGIPALFPYGSGIDGDVVISSNTSLSRDMYYDDLTVNTGITLTANGFKIFVRGTLTTIGTGKIVSNGNTGGAGTAGSSGGAGGIAGAAAYTTGSLPIPRAGVAGGDGGATGGGAGAAGAAGVAQAKALGGWNSVAGGAGGATGGTAGAGGALAATTTAMFAPPYSYTAAYNLFDLSGSTITQYGVAPSGGGGGGGSGGVGGPCPSCVGGGGGGSGSSGGVVWIAARTIASLNAEAKGGAGGIGGVNENTAADGGGGAGGNGGTIILMYTTASNITTDVTGGSGGAAGGADGSPAAGTNGATGTVYTLQLSQ